MSEHQRLDSSMSGQHILSAWAVAALFFVGLAIFSVIREPSVVAHQPIEGDHTRFAKDATPSSYEYLGHKSAVIVSSSWSNPMTVGLERAGY